MISAGTVNRAAGARIHIVQNILTRMKDGVADDDARILRSFAETPLEEVMPLVNLASTVIARELERTRAETGDVP